MDVVSTCKKKLMRLRIKELKDILTRLGLSKQGKKQDLMDRILALLPDEVSDMHGLAKKKSFDKGVAEMIDDACRKLPCVGSTSSVEGDTFSEVNNMKPKEEVTDSVYSDKRIRCPCGSSAPTEYMIQCVDSNCSVWQHVSCVIIPEDGSQGFRPNPAEFYCEICRINRADPFWVTVAHPLSPIKLITASIPSDGTSPLQNVERTFQLTKAHRDLLSCTDYDVQAWCILLNDKVSFRMQWPLFGDLIVNGVRVRTVYRPGSQLLGAHGRDNGPMIASYIVEGVNQISLSGCDARSFCLGVRLAKQRTIEQILNIIIEEQNNEPFEDALARVYRCIGGGRAMENEDSENDLEFLMEHVTVNLRCPMSGSRIRTAGRCRPCAHLGCFDLETFVQLNQRSRKWECPVCLKSYSLEDITIDRYFDQIVKMVEACGENISEIDVKPDGCWRGKNVCQFKSLEQWHFPDGSICVSNLGASRHLEEGGIVGHDPKKSCKPKDMQTSSRNQLGECLNYSQEVITMSSSSSESHGNDLDYSINQYGMAHFGTSANKMNTTSSNSEVAARTLNRSTSASLWDPNMIVLSDSEEENTNLTSRENCSITQAVHDGLNSFSSPPGISNAHQSISAFDAGVTSPLGLYSSPDCDFEMSLQAFSSGTQAGSPFQRLLADNVSGGLVDSGYTVPTSSVPTDGCKLTYECAMYPNRQVVDSLLHHSDTETDDILSDLDNNSQTSNRIVDKLNSLGAGSSRSGCDHSAGLHAKPPTPNGPHTVDQFGSNEVLLPTGIHDEGWSKAIINDRRSCDPFSFPRKPRSAKHQYHSQI